MQYSHRKPLLCIAAAFTMLISSTQAVAQTPARSRLAVIGLQNASQQQQAALQVAVQQTNILIQQATQQDVPPGSADFHSPLNFGPQLAALQFALQQSAATQLIVARSGPPHLSFSQATTIQSALQTSMSLQAALQIQSGPITNEQLQSLFREQTELTSQSFSPK
jgi:hypothetical protein